MEKETQIIGNHNQMRLRKTKKMSGSNIPVAVLGRASWTWISRQSPEHIPGIDSMTPAHLTVGREQDSPLLTGEHTIRPQDQKLIP